MCVLVKEFAKKEEIKTTAITEYELLKHKNALKRPLAEDFLSEITVCSFDSSSARKAASLYQKLKDKGRMINENDLLIAGISLTKEEVLLTRDKKFANINDEKIKLV